MMPTTPPPIFWKSSFGLVLSILFYCERRWDGGAFGVWREAGSAQARHLSVVRLVGVGARIRLPPQRCPEVIDKQNFNTRACSDRNHVRLAGSSSFIATSHFGFDLPSSYKSSLLFHPIYSQPLTSPLKFYWGFIAHWGGKETYRIKLN